MVAAAASLPEVVRRLAPLGYRHRGDRGILGREVFRAPPHLPAHHLYVCAEGTRPLREHLAFRDHLRTHGEAAAAYAHLKQALAAAHVNDRAAYQAGKREFIDRIVGLALDV